MRRHHHLHILATAATAAALSAPAAHAEAISNGGGGEPLPTNHIAAASRQPTSTDWMLIALAGGGAIAVTGTGLTASRRLKQRHTSTPQAETSHLVSPAQDERSNLTIHQ